MYNNGTVEELLSGPENRACSPKIDIGSAGFGSVTTGATGTDDRIWALDIWLNALAEENSGHSRPKSDIPCVAKGGQK